MSACIDELEQMIVAASACFPFIRSISFVDKTPIALKVRLELAPELFVQIYPYRLIFSLFAISFPRSAWERARTGKLNLN